jgi:hypothetical protein
MRTLGDIAAQIQLLSRAEMTLKATAMVEDVLPFRFSFLPR